MSNFFILRLFLFFTLIASAVALKNKSAQCKDTSHECKEIVDKCGDKRHSWLVKLKCPETCNSCVKKKSSKKEKCKDVYTNCEKYLENCKIEQYKKLMSKFCAHSCSFCKAQTKTKKSKCHDSIEHCEELTLHGFCNNTALTSNQRREICGQSCNLCS